MISPSRWQKVVLVVAMCFLAGVVGWWVNEPAEEHFDAVDTGFLSDMVLHHGGAIGLSFAYLGVEHDPLVGHFARDIVVAQSQEVGLMNSLLAAAGDVAESDPDGDETVMAWMGEPTPASQMPGMASAAELDELRGATGLAADDQFTRLMIGHHAAGVGMADYARQHGENARVRRLATSIAKVQRVEISELNARRAALGLDRIDPATLDLGHLSHR